MALSVVIPTLNAAPTLAPTLSALAGGADEVIVADGGSEDGTLEIARRMGARVIEATRGRGAQLAAGARSARGAWLLFLHADTVLGTPWADDARDFMAEPGNGERAAVFRFILDDEAAAARRLEAVVAWRTRMLGLPYGDQGLLIARAFYDALGGYRPLPLMEDVDLVRRIGRSRIVPLGAPAVTSAERWRRDGWLGRSARNLFCLGLYWTGVSPRVIRRLYG